MNTTLKQHLCDHEEMDTIFKQITPNDSLLKIKLLASELVILIDRNKIGYIPAFLNENENIRRIKESIKMLTPKHPGEVDCLNDDVWNKYKRILAILNEIEYLADLGE